MSMLLKHDSCFMPWHIEMSGHHGIVHTSDTPCSDKGTTMSIETHAQNTASASLLLSPCLLASVLTPSSIP